MSMAMVTDKHRQKAAVSNAMGACAHQATYSNGLPVPNGYVIDASMSIVLKNGMSLLVMPGDHVLVGEMLVRVKSGHEVHDIVIDTISLVSYTMLADLW